MVLSNVRQVFYCHPIRCSFDNSNIALNSPFHGGSPTRKSLEETSSNGGSNSRHQDPRYRDEDWECSRKRSMPKDGSAFPDVSPLLENADGLDSRALRKLRKQQKKKAKREKKL